MAQGLAVVRAAHTDGGLGRRREKLRNEPNLRLGCQWHRARVLCRRPLPTGDWGGSTESYETNPICDWGADGKGVTPRAEGAPGVETTRRSLFDR